MSTNTVMQNVNLYLPEFRKKKTWLDAERTVLVAGAGVALLVVVSGVESWQLFQLRGELEAKGVEYQQETAATAALLAQYGTQTEDPALLEDIQALETDLQSKQALLQFLEGREVGNAEGFSEYLADLSRYHVPGLSLNYVSLTEGGRTVELAGEVLKADLPPTYLQELAKGSAYAGMEFDSLKINGIPADFVSGVTDNEIATWSVRSLKQ